MDSAIASRNCRWIADRAQGNKEHMLPKDPHQFAAQFQTKSCLARPSRASQRHQPYSRVAQQLLDCFNFTLASY